MVAIEDRGMSSDSAGLLRFVWQQYRLTEKAKKSGIAQFIALMLRSQQDMSKNLGGDGSPVLLSPRDFLA